jgi:membrane protein
MYRFLPNTTFEWRDVWVGAMITSVLFNFGKLGLCPYIGKGAIGSSYGAVGSILVLLLWIYYSGLIFYFGAEFTKVYAEQYGSSKTEKQIGAKRSLSQRYRVSDEKKMLRPPSAKIASGNSETVSMTVHIGALAE